MNALLIFSSFVAYSALIFFVTYLTSKNAGNRAYFLGNKNSPWYIVAYGMIGASLSGVTFMSVPGWVGTTQFSYLVMVLGYFTGYIIIITVLLPLYYRMNLTSIYSYLDTRFGFWSYKTGAFFFIISRTIGASFRMFLVINVLQLFVFEQWGVPFWFSVLIFIILIILYTFEGGIKTIIWTDTLQTTFMLLGVITSVYIISRELNFSLPDLIIEIGRSEYSKIIFTDTGDKRHFIKQFLAGMFITITMTGLDQEMMQKNLSCRNLKEAQKNMFSFSIVLIFINLLFLALGATLYIYANTKGISIPDKTDDLFPTIAIQYLGPVAGLIFIIGLISAAYPSADGALTSLTTSFCVDFLGMDKKEDNQNEKRKRYIIHFSFAAIMMLTIIIFKAINNEAVISKLFTVAGYTYGPLLGLFAFGLFTKQKVRDTLVPFICIASPIICYYLNENSVWLLNGYKFGFELLLVNGFLTFIGLLLLRKKSNPILT